MQKLTVVFAMVFVQCAQNTSPATPARTTSATPSASATTLRTTFFPLPGASGAVSLDYLACDRAAGLVWVPAGETGSVDRIDTASGKITAIPGFATAEREARGSKRLVGPSAATVGGGFAFVGNRADSNVCALDEKTGAIAGCLAMPSSPDGLAYVAATKEVWVTLPRDKSIAVVDASSPQKLAMKAKIAFDGAPEGYAVDDARALFYTNLEDLNKTLVVDIHTRQIVSTWEPHCGADGPRGLAIDSTKSLVFVACTDHIQVLDAAHAGAPLSQLPTGAGVDNIDYLESKQHLYVAAGKAATLTVAKCDDKGRLSVLATVPTSEGARVVVAASDGTAYVADGKMGRVIAVAPVP